jgi:UDP-N-acetylmuramate dehydrogenase
LSEPSNGSVTLAERFREQAIPFRSEESLSRYTSIGLGGPAEFLVSPSSIDQLASILALTSEVGLPFVVLGAGSNLLIGDAGVRGVVIHTARLAAVDFLGEGIVEAGAGVHFPALVRQTAARGLRGLQAGVGIPGSLGGVLTMNAGAYDFAIGPRVAEVEAVSPGRGRVLLHRGEIDFRYRSSSFGPDLIVAKARLALDPDDPVAIKRDMDRHMRFRKETQPVGVKSAGCIFKNPEGDSAGRLIDLAGLKGFRVGGARVSEVHANFIVQEGGATTADVLELIHAIREKVQRATAVVLEPEVMTWNAQEAWRQ